VVARTPAAARPSAPSAPRRLVVCGDDPLAHRLIEELINRYGAEITAVLPDRRRNHGPQIARISGVRVVEADRLDADTFRRARVHTADGLALVKQDDVGNIDAALQAQELNPGLRLVIRMFNMSLGHGIRRMISDCAVLSDASMAAPALVSVALGEVAPVHVRLPGRTIYVTRRADVAASDVLCGLAKDPRSGSDGDTEPELLPADQDGADLVLAVATGTSPPTRRQRVYRRLTRGLRRRRRRRAASERAGSERVASERVGSERVGSERVGSERVGSERVGSERARWWRFGWRRAGWRRSNPFGVLRPLINRKLRVAALALIGCLVVGTGVLAQVKDIPWWNAAYLTIMASLGGTDVNLQASPAEKITQTALTISSIALIPVLTAAVVEAAVNARLTMALGRIRRPIADHVVVVGLGNVGTRVIRQLHALGIPVVAVDRSGNARGVQASRELSIPFIEGDASQLETLRAASVETSRALLVLSTDDVTNLEAALLARTLKEDLRVVLRLFDGDFAGRVQRAFGIPISRSVSFLAAPAFAAALMEQEIFGTIPINRHVLLIAEARVCAGSDLDGAAVSAANVVGQLRVIALNTDRGDQALWCPPLERVLRPGDVLVVVATRAGLGSVLARAGEPGARGHDASRSSGAGNDASDSGPGPADPAGRTAEAARRTADRARRTADAIRRTRDAGRQFGTVGGRPE